jgi:hypothetical protein
MRQCAACNRTFSDPGLRFCLYDGAPLSPGEIVEPPVRRRGVRRTLAVAIAGLVIVFAAGVLHARNTPDEATIEAAIERADTIEARAMFTLDPSSLASAFSGTALADEERRIEDLRRNDAYVDQQLVSATIDSMTLEPSGAQVRVHLTERWKATLYSNATKTAIRDLGQSIDPQTMFLQRSANGWIVTSIVPG